MYKLQIWQAFLIKKKISIFVAKKKKKGQEKFATKLAFLTHI